MGLTKLSSDEKHLADYYVYRRFHRVQREYWVHPYLKKNGKSRLFLAATELSQTDRKFIALYRMSKGFYPELTRIERPFVAKMLLHFSYEVHV